MNTTKCYDNTGNPCNSDKKITHTNFRNGYATLNKKSLNG